MRALLFSVLALAACASPAPPPSPAPTSAPQPAPQVSAPGIVATEIGATADLGNGLNVRPIAIIEDSRCPQNVDCLWAGRMRIRASVSGRDVELQLGETTQTPSGAVEFAIASPGAWADWPSDELGPRPAYRFGFRRGS
jgi:hypothetical protein